MAEDQESLEKRRVQIIAPTYYSRKDIQDAIFEFCKHRETVPRYLEGFGKRPDALDYPSDINILVKKGATSFHCSEEIWNDPLKINTDMTPQQYNEIKSGWDFLIDIDSKYLDYSIIAAKLIIKFLEHHGIKHVGIKFSGSKGFHILVPWNAFPKELNGEETKNKFPEWPRAIAGYVSESIHDRLVEEMLKISNIQGEYEVRYAPTGEPAIEKKVAHYICKNCKAKMDSLKASKKILRCHLCNYDMEKLSEETIYMAESNHDNSQKSPKKFIKKISAKNLIDTVDIVLVAPRHLFRAPYSLHEKTCLASVVLTKEELENFNVRIADPMRMKIRNYDPKAEDGEARELLIQSLDWVKKKNPSSSEKKFEGKGIDVKGLKMDESMFPEVIKKLMNGMKSDGRKRALSVLLAFFTSLEFPKEYIQEKISEWNLKNYKPLRDGYIKSQIDWSLKNKRLPPNYDKSTYKELGVLSETNGLKNPINYTIREAMRGSWNSERKKNPERK